MMKRRCSTSWSSLPERNGRTGSALVAVCWKVFCKSRNAWPMMMSWCCSKSFFTGRTRRNYWKNCWNGRSQKPLSLLRAHYPRYSTIRGNFQIVAIYKDFKEISSDNVTTILESPATDSPFSVLQNFPFAERTISRSNPGYACSQSPVKAQRTVRS